MLSHTRAHTYMYTYTHDLLYIIINDDDGDVNYMQMRRWKAWERETRTAEYQFHGQYKSKRAWLIEPRLFFFPFFFKFMQFLHASVFVIINY